MSCPRESNAGLCSAWEASTIAKSYSNSLLIARSICISPNSLRPWLQRNLVCELHESRLSTNKHSIAHLLLLYGWHSWIFRQEVRERDLLQRLERLPATVARPMIRALTWPQEDDLQVNIYWHQTFPIFIINFLNFVTYTSSLKGKREAKKHQFPWIAR
jgi:hypothetical protein